MAEQAQVIGKAMIVYGTVKAESTDGVARVLQPNSPIFIDDRINTGSDGAVSIVFNDADNTQLDLGRMTDMVIDESILSSEELNLEDVTVEVEAIQEALETGDEIVLEETAAGGAAAGDGSGGNQVVKFVVDGKIGEVTSGAETVGVDYDFTGSELQFVAVPEIIQPEPVVPPPEPEAPAPAAPIVLAAAPLPPEPEPVPEPTPPPTPPPEDNPPILADDTNWVQEDVDFVESEYGNAPTAAGNVLAALGDIPHGNAPDDDEIDVYDPDVDREDFQDTDPDGDTLTVTKINFGSSEADLSGSGSASIAGTYGTLYLDENGDYFYLLDNDNPAVQALDDFDDADNPGDTLEEQFTYSATDGVFTEDATLTITIFGTNDAPVAKADTNWVKEETTLAATGNVLVDDPHDGDPSAAADFADVADTDVDTGDTLTVTNINFGSVNADPTVSGGATIAGLYGTLNIDDLGNYTYTLDNSNTAVQALDEFDDAGDLGSQTITDTFTYTVSDGDAPVTANLDITIFGTNDAPVAKADTNWVKEETTLAATGNVLVNVLHDGDPSTAAVFADVADTDVDTGDTLTVTNIFNGTDNADPTVSGGATIAGLYGTLNIDDLGNYTYTLNNSNTAVQALDEFDDAGDLGSQTITDTFTYTVSDGDAPVTANLEITIFGTNDAPVAKADTNWVKEETTLAATGNVLVDVLHDGDPSTAAVFADVADTDVDTGDTLTVTNIFNGTDNADPTVSGGATIAGLYGTLNIDDLGNYTYTLNNSNTAVQALDEFDDAGDLGSQTLTDTFTYTVSDGDAPVTANLEITIFGTNDAPVAKADTNWVKEETTLAATGNVLVDDPHDGDPSAAADFADVADTDVDTGDTLTVTNIFNGTVNADPTVSGGATIAGLYGTLNIDDLGNYTYTLDNSNTAVQALDEFDDAGDLGSQTLTDTFTYTVSAGDAPVTANLEITIFGTNDAPVAKADTNWVKEETTLAATGNVLVDVLHDGDPSTAAVFADVADTDVDTGDTLTVTNIFNGTDNADPTVSGGATIAGLYGTLNIDDLGNYTYTLNNSNTAVQALDEFDDAGDLGSQTLTDTFTYTVSDGDAPVTANLEITIFGTNDAPVAKADTNWVKEETTLAATGNVLVDDPHDGDPSAAADFADVADTDVDTGDTLTVTNIFNGTDNADPTVSGGATIAGLYGTLNIDDLGNYTYTLNNSNTAVQALDEFDDAGDLGSQTLTDTFTYTVSDGDAPVTANLEITIFGTNDAPVAKADTNWVKEETTLAATGNVLVDVLHDGDPSTAAVFADVADTDVDTGDTLTVTNIFNGTDNADPTVSGGATIAGLYGTLNIDDLGNYTYTLNNSNTAVQALDEFDDAGDLGSQTLTDTFTYTVSDGDAPVTANLEITIFGTNDAPVAKADTNWVKEETTLAATGNVLVDVLHDGDPSAAAVFADVADTDVDTGDTLTVTNIFNGTDNADPTVSGGATIAGLYGTLNIDDLGNYTYTLNNSNTAVQALDEFDDAGDLGSQTLTDTFTYTVSDGDAPVTANLEITIFGTNDAPVAKADTNWVKEETTLAATGNVLVDVLHDGDPSTAAVFADVADTDVDTGDTLTVTNIFNGTDNADPTVSGGATIAGLYGTLNIDDLGNYTYTLNNSNTAVQALDEFDDAGDLGSQTLTDTFTYTVSDGDAPVTANLEITIFGTNDAPTLTVDSGAVYEAGLPEGTRVGDTTITDTGQIDFKDVDGDSLELIVNNTSYGTFDGNGGTVVGTVDGSNGTITFFGDGSWSYTLTDNTNAHGQIAKGAPQSDPTVPDTFSIEVFDGTVSSGPQDLTINIHDDGVLVTEVSNAVIANEPGLTLVGAFNTVGADDDTVGTTDFYTADLTSNITALGGTTFADSGQFSDFNPVYYYVDPNNPSILIAYTDVSSGGPGEYDETNGSQSKVFTVEAKPNEDTFEVKTYAEINEFTTVTASAAGQPTKPSAFIIVTDNGDNTATVTAANTAPTGDYLFILTAGQGGTLVNGSNGGFGVNNNNMDDGEILRMDLFEPAYSVTLTLSNQHDTDDPTSAVGKGEMTYVAYDADGKVIASGNYIGPDSSPGEDSFTIIPDGEFAGSGIKSVDIGLDPTISSNDSYKIPAISVTTIEQGQDTEQSFDVLVTDSDGDFTTTTINVTFDNDGVLEGTEYNDVLVGGTGNEDLYGHGGNDILIGGDGEDDLYGGAGDDILVGDIVDYDAESNPPYADVDIVEDNDVDNIYGGEDSSGGSGTDQDVAIDADEAPSLSEDKVFEATPVDESGSFEGEDPLALLIPPPDDSGTP